MATYQPSVPLAVRVVRVQLVQVQLMPAQLLQELEAHGHLVHLVEHSAAQVQGVTASSAMVSPVDKQDTQYTHLEPLLHSDHPAPAPLIALETSAPRPRVELAAPVSVLETKVDFPVSARHNGAQAVFLDQTLGLGAPASAWEADLHLPALGQEEMPEATALPHQAHQDFTEV